MAQVSGGVESITQETLDFVQKVIERFCVVANLRIFPPWNGRRVPMHQIDGVRITRERCGLEYPRLGIGTKHFLSGLTLSVSENGEGHVFLRFSPHHGPHSRPQPTAIDLTACQRLMCESPSSFKPLFSFQINNAIAIAMREDEKGLEQYR